MCAVHQEHDQADWYHHHDADECCENCCEGEEAHA